MNPTTSTRSYYPALDGLRGFAILLVICCHNFDFLPYFEFGWIGVDLFFVLSGFLITDILLKTRESRHFLRNFYIRRILKIFPLYYGVLLLFFLLAPLLSSLSVQFTYYKTNQPFLWMNLQNWLCTIHIMPVENMALSHLWSLSIEEQFYLVWPLLVLFIRNTRVLAQVAIGTMVMCVLFRTLSWYNYGSGLTTFYIQYMTRMDGLCIGSLVAIWRLNDKTSAGGKILRMAAIITGVQLVLFLISKSFGPIPHVNFTGFTLLSVFFGVLVFLVVENRNVVTRILLENTVIKFLGKISYSLYVFHWPILALFKIYLLKTIIGYGFSEYTGYALMSVSALLVALFISIASFYLFEKRILALKDIVTEEGFFGRLWKKLVLLFTPASARKSGSQ